MKAVIVRAHGGPEVLQVEDLPVPRPGRAEILVKNQAIGLNFVDTQHRAGQNYPVELPLIPGVEAAGFVEDVGEEASEFKPGDRVGYAGYMGGNYAEYTVVPEEKLVPIPKAVDFKAAAASLLQGMTAHCLTQSVYPIKADDVVLIHAGAGGVGLFLVQMARNAGAKVITTVSNAEKAERATALGADEVILYTQVDFAIETMRLTEGAGVHAVFDAVGKATFEQGIQVLRPQGYMILYGLSSGPVPPYDINRLSGITGSNNKGSLFLTWPTLSDYAATREDLLWRASDVMKWIQDGIIQVQLAQVLPLADVAEAHRMLQSRQVIGKLVLIP